LTRRLEVSKSGVWSSCPSNCHCGRRCRRCRRCG
jgi:hypothetical protein